MLNEIQKALKFNEPKTIGVLMDEVECSWQQAKSTLGQLTSVGLCRPTASGYVRSR